MTDNKTYNINRIDIANFFVETTESIDLPEEINFKSAWHKISNYVKTLFFLSITFLTWILTGWFASTSFPYALAQDLIKYSWSGFFQKEQKNSFWKNLRYSIATLNSLQTVKKTNDIDEATQLNKQDSYYWLLIQLLEILENDIQKPEKIFWQIRQLEDQRIVISDRLEPLKKRYLKNIYKIQRVSQKFKIYSRNAKTYEEINLVLKLLTRKYISSTVPSELEVRSFLTELQDQLSAVSQTQSLYNVFKIANWIHSHTLYAPDSDSEEIDNSYYSIRAYSSNANTKYHTQRECKFYPKIEKQEDVLKIQDYQSIQSAEEDGRTICSICERISEAKNSLSQRT
ncbi:MAG: hypothetical protein HC799_01870 [Limnothrix sp. RL_2_0]|nr:hypothetical protein [Limnothrix sp. RL_2_0]